MQITIPAGAFESSNTRLSLEVKEAFTIDDILQAGLRTTTTDGQPLSSNGMFYINLARGQQGKLVKGLGIRSPASEYDSSAQLYTGKDNNGKITWEDPKPVLQNGAQKELALGKQLFSNNCASCHKIDKALTGPALLHVTKRLPRKWLYDFTRNTNKVIGSGDCYANSLFKAWNKTAMNQFPNFDSLEMKNLYDYIDQESNRLSPATAGDTLWHMPDCEKYQNQLDSLLAKKNAFTKIIGSMTNVNRVQPPDSSDMDYGGTIPKVVADNYDATHYQFNIEALGWYNIDILLKDINNYIISTLRLQIKYGYKARVNVFLVIPRKKIFQEGGILSDDSYYGFWGQEGTIPLPQNEAGIVFAIGESEGKAIFGRVDFVSAKDQTFTLEMQPYSQAEISKKLSALSCCGIKTGVEFDHYMEKAAIDSAINMLYKLREKGCDCWPNLDSVMTGYEYISKK
ncbi:MAG: cytochrome c [Chitinophagaceae bacterium]